MKEKISDKKWFIYALVPLCALCWGFSYLGITVTLKSLEPIQLLAMRWTVSALIFLILAACRIIKVQYKGKDIKLVLTVGILQPCIYSIFETVGVKLTTTSESSIFIATIPLMVLIIGSLILHKKNSRRTILAIVMAFAGVVICVAFSPNFSLGGKGLGYLILFCAVLTGAFYTYTSSKAAEQFDAIEVTFSIAVMGGIFFNCVSFAMGYGFSGYRACLTDMKLLAGVLFLGICCSSLCYLIFNFVLGKLPTAIATNLVTNSTTAVGVISGCAFAGDPFGWYTVAGVALTITGVCLSSLGNKELADSSPVAGDEVNTDKMKAK
ncbi:putative DMT superfamily transporter inner membrane protein [uncultured Eubacterium sp.]|nr:putative DMT superfamily transporter inner membrane protein [uncultured Eubacterium sp.]